ncbi:MAG: aldo/keto reductase [Gallionellaceae bacterium]
MRGIAILQARTTSSRLPGKVLLPINGIPIVVLAAKRAANTGREVIVATSVESSDDGLASLIDSYGLLCSRGSLENSLERMVEALSGNDDDTIVFRLTADNVFPDGALLDEIEQDFMDRKLEYLCCNGEPSGLPYGMSAEVTRLGHLREAAGKSKSAYDKEHVTPYIIRKFGAHYFEKYKPLKKGHYRCTIDCLDDYLCAVKVFANVEDPVAVSPFKLLEKLEACRYQPMESGPVSRLVLGTAQLGMHYGIANKTGQPSETLGQELIKTAIANGVIFLDTARAYGKSEEVVGKTLKNGWQGRAKIITKLSPLAECPADASAQTVRAYVDASVYQSCAALGMQHLDVLMLHRAAHLDEWDGAVWQRLLDLKAAGIIKELGISVQNPEELERSLSVNELAFIQMPFNILDWRWDALIPQIISARQNRKLAIHVRSILLQGLLPSVAADQWLKANIEDPGKIMQWLKDRSASCGRADVTDLCLGYVHAQDWVDGLVIGMENMGQLAENIKYLNRPPLSAAEVRSIRNDRPELSDAALNPALWRNQE